MMAQNRIFVNKKILNSSSKAYKLAQELLKVVNEGSKKKN